MTCFIINFSAISLINHQQPQQIIYQLFMTNGQYWVNWLCCAAVQLLFLAERLCGYFPVLSVVSSLLQLTPPLAAVASLCWTPGMRLSWGGRLRCRLLIFPWQLPPPVLGGEKNSEQKNLRGISNLMAKHAIIPFLRFNSLKLVILWHKKELPTGTIILTTGMQDYQIDGSFCLCHRKMSRFK